MAAILEAHLGQIVLHKTSNYFEGYVLYAARVTSPFDTTGREHVIAAVPEHLAILPSAHLSDLAWANLQTRSLTNGYGLKKVTWHPSRSTTSFMFQAIDRSPGSTKYVFENLEMILLHDPKKKSVMGPSLYQYPASMASMAALGTFRCVISKM